jgi:heat shock protein HslJ
MKIFYRLIVIIITLLVSACAASPNPTEDALLPEIATTTVENDKDITNRAEAGSTPDAAVVEEPENLIPVEDLMNATYRGINEEPITLSDGEYKEEFLTVQYREGTELIGDLDGDGTEDAVVFLIVRGGGTAAFTYIAAQLNQNGRPLDAGAVLVEDRTQIRSAAIENGQIILDIIAHGPGDPDCCATYHATRTYNLQEGILVDTSAENVEMEKVSANDLDGTSWILIELDQETSRLAESEVTLEFHDSKLSGSGECNSYKSSFELGDLNPFILSIKPIAATKKACPEAILNQEDRYFKALESASLWGYDYGKLTLASVDNQGELNRLLFIPKEGTKMIMNKPEYIIRLENAYGAPSQNGFGSAVFFEKLMGADELEKSAQQKYQFFVGKNWERFGEEAWMSAWKLVYTRPARTKPDILAELQGITDLDASLSVPMILTGIENAEAAQKALADTFNDPTMADLVVYNLGDGGAMSGILVAGRRGNGETTFLVFLYD